MSCGFFRFSFLGFWDWRVGDVEEAFGSGRCILGGSFARGLRFFWGLLLRMSTKHMRCSNLSENIAEVWID